ncbi:MAG: putative manganese efflux pump MntP [Candidatus Tectimicrobiota bacterium]|nr:MAG: putative manganese efflux pump MntP [Candidatus Tectomicrobia bacterium]
MTLWELLLLATALAMDAFAVAVATAMRPEEAPHRLAWRLAGHFGFFQAAMPVAGWGIGAAAHAVVAPFDHWLAFVLLAGVGLKMIYGGLSAEAAAPRDPTRFLTLLGLALATSLDAFAAGLSLAALRLPILVPAGLIGLITAAWTLLGVRLGRWAGARLPLGPYAEVLGGLVLLALGGRVLYEHGVFS